MKKRNKGTVVVAIPSGKGGCSKSTIALNLAASAAATGLSTVVLDLDPQGSVTKWAMARPEEGVAELTVRQIPATAAVSAVQKMRDAGADLVVIDFPPANQAFLQTVAEAVDLIVVPVSVSDFDLLGIEPTVELLRARNLLHKAVCVVSMAEPRKGGKAEADEAAEFVLEKFKLPCIGVTYRRKVYRMSIRSGLGVCELEPKSKASEEAAALALSILERARGE